MANFASQNVLSPIPDFHHKQKGTIWCLFAYGGSEENRTPVRKPIHTTFFVDSLLFRIPVWEREQTRYPVR